MIKGSVEIQSYKSKKMNYLVPEFYCEGNKNLAQFFFFLNFPGHDCLLLCPIFRR